MDQSRSKIILFLIISFSFISAQNLRITSPKTNDPISADGEVEITWNSSNYNGDIIIQWAKTSWTSSWSDIDKVAVNEDSYYWYLPSELENYRGKIIIKISAINMSWVKDEVTIGSASSSATELVAFVDTFKPRAGGYLEISWNRSVPVKIYYSKTKLYRGRNAAKNLITRTYSSGKMYKWKIPDNFGDERIRITVEDANSKVSSDPIIVEVVKKVSSATVSPKSKTSFKLGLIVDNYYPKTGSYLNISWNKTIAVDLHYIRNSGYMNFVKHFPGYDNNYRMYIPTVYAGDNLRIQITDKSGNYDYIDVYPKSSTKHTTRSSTKRPPVTSSSNSDDECCFWCVMGLALLFLL